MFGFCNANTKLLFYYPTREIIKPDIALVVYCVDHITSVALQLFIALFKNLVGYHFDNLLNSFVAKVFFSSDSYIT